MPASLIFTFLLKLFLRVSPCRIFVMDGRFVMVDPWFGGKDGAWVAGVGVTGYWGL